MKNKKTNIGWIFLILLTIVFTVLKLTGLVAWSWWWVLAPIWAPVLFGTVFLTIVLISIVVYAIVKEVTVQIQHDMKAKARAKSNEAIIDTMAAEYGLEREPGESNVELKKRIAIEKQKARRARNGMEE